MSEETVVESPVESDDLLASVANGEFWVVAHTRPRCEKKLEAFCARNSVPTFLPLRKKVHRYGRRQRHFFLPLFTGYVFCRVTEQSRMLLRQNDHVANVLRTPRQDEMLAQLRAVRAALESGKAVDVMPFLEAGKPVRITHGPMKGAEGVVVRLKGKERVVINVDIIRSSVAVEIDHSFLAPL